MGKQKNNIEPQEQAKEEVLEPTFGMSLKTYISEMVEKFWGDIDPAKLESIKKEVIVMLKKGSYTATGIVSVVAIMVVGELWFNGKIYGGAHIGTLSVGLKTPSQVQEQVVAEMQSFLKKPIQFEYQGQKLALTPEELGVAYDIEQTIATLPRYRFLETNPLLIAASSITKQEMPMQFSYDRTKAIKALEQKFGLSESRAKNASIVLKDKDFVIEPEKAGKAMNEERLLASLRTDFARLENNSITIVTEDEQPRITAKELSEQKDALIAKIQKPLTLTTDSKKYSFKLSDQLAAVELGEKPYLEVKGTSIKLPIQLGEKEISMNEESPVAIRSNMEVKVNGAILDPVLHEEFIKNIEKPTSAVDISKNEDGTINIVGKGEDGQSVPRNRLMAAISLAVNNGITEIPVPVIVEKAPVTISDDLKELGIRELLATGHSSYYGSPANRAHNIATGIKRFNGVLIAPGEEFSFNTQLGEVDGAHGYKLEKVIKKNKAEYEMGGGICQVSTTAYRGALLAGLPISERREHTWKVAYYGQTMGNGLDATIYLGGQDLKFVNDTPNHILMQAYQEDSNAYFKFYGTSDGRVAKLDGPYGGGLNWKWYRTILKDGKETKETITANYKPIPPPDPPKPAVTAQAPTT